MNRRTEDAAFGRNCGRCHECGTKLRSVLDGEEWCRTCGAYRRYRSHGWGRNGDNSPCPHLETLIYERPRGSGGVHPGT